MFEELWGDTARMAEPNSPQGYLTPQYYTTTIRTVRKEEEGGTFGVLVTVTARKRHCRKWLNICLPIGSSEWIPYCFCIWLSLLTKPSLSQPTSSQAWALAWEQASSWMVYSSRLGLNHNNQWTELQLLSACFLYHRNSYYSPVMQNTIFSQETFAELMFNYEKTLYRLSGRQNNSKV